MHKDIKSENLMIIFYKLFTVKKFDLNIYVCFLSGFALAKNFKMPLHIAHICKAPRANAEANALPKSAFFASTHIAT
jgi:hypothetical protein